MKNFVDELADRAQRLTGEDVSKHVVDASTAPRQPQLNWRVYDEHEVKLLKRIQSNGRVYKKGEIVTASWTGGGFWLSSGCAMLRCDAKLGVDFDLTPDTSQGLTSPFFFFMIQY